MPSQLANFAVRFEAIRAPQWDDQYLRAFMLGAVREFAEEKVKQFDKTVSYWKSGKPKFSWSVSTKKGEDITATISYDNPIYGYIDKGVPGHVIAAPQKVRRFTKTFGAGSTPGTLSVGGSVQRSSEWVSINKDINWPGIRARNFSERIRDESESGPDNFGFRIQTALNKAASNVWRKNG